MDFDISPLWKGQHTFLKPVIFSPGQAFSGANLKFSNQNKGAISFYDGSEWKILESGSAAQVLMIVNGIPSWGNVDISKSIGVLSVENGGTGISKYELGSMLVSNTKNSLSKLTPGKNGQVLTVNEKFPTWCDFPGVVGSGKSSYLTIWASDKDICATNIQVDNNSLILKEKNSSLHLGNISLSSEDDIFTINLGKESLVLAKDTFTIQQNNKTILKFWKGKLITGCIPVDKLDGVVKAINGGTGIEQYSIGSILYASKNDTLSALSIDNADGFYLKAVNGIPQWAPVENSVSARTTNVATLELSAGTTYRVPLQFQLGELSNSPQLGAVEWDGQNILVTTKDNQRKALVFDGENINALSKGVSEPVLTNMGGTGKNLSNKPIGSILFIESNTNVGILSPESEKFIKFDKNGIPSLSHAVLSIIGDNGINVSAVNEYTPCLSIDQTSNFNPTWNGVHTFTNNVLLGKDTTFILPQNLESGLPQIHFEQCHEPKQKQNGDVWFDDDLFVYVNGSTINITAKTNQSFTQAQHLCICSGVSPESNIRKIKHPLPYGSDGITKIKWKFVRADLRIEDSPVDKDGKLKIYVNGESLLESELTVSVGSQSTNSQHFIMPYAYSGDLISLEFCETGGGDCWSLYLTILGDN